MRNIIKINVLLMTIMLVVSMIGCDTGNNKKNWWPLLLLGGNPIGAVCSGGGCVSLGTTANYVIVGQSAISNTPTSKVTGNMAISPLTASFITGFALAVDASNDFSRSAQVTGKIYAPDYTGGQLGSLGTTPAMMIVVQTDMIAAYNDAAGKTEGVGPNLDKGAGTIPDGTNFAAGNYTWKTPGTSGGNVNMTGNITLTGTATDIWIFQIQGVLTLASATNIILAGGAQAMNVFWVVKGSGAIIGTTAHFEGILLSKTLITLGTGATVKGRLQAQTAVTLAKNTVTVP